MVAEAIVVARGDGTELVGVIAGAGAIVVTGSIVFALAIVVGGAGDAVTVGVIAFAGAFVVTGAIVGG